MVGLRVIVDGEGSMPNLSVDGVTEGRLETVVALANGTLMGKPSIGFFIAMPDGSTVWTETTMSLFVAAARAFVARHGEPT